MSKSKTASCFLIAAERRVKALAMRREGESYRAIAGALGISVGRAFSLVQREIEQLGEQTREEAEMLRQLEIERLNEMQKSIWPQVLQGDQGAINTCLRIMERRARLYGLDAPTKIETEGGGIVAVEKVFVMLSGPGYAEALAQIDNDEVTALPAGSSAPAIDAEPVEVGAAPDVPLKML